MNRHDLVLRGVVWVRVHTWWCRLQGARWKARWRCMTVLPWCKCPGR